MLKSSYNAAMGKWDDKTWENWCQVTEQDDSRRYKALQEVCEGKNVLEFGCGNGGFLRRIKEVAADVTGIELMDEARRNMELEGIRVYKTKDGILICETVNAEDSLISKYKCKAFENFTYWSEHVYLFNSDTLPKLFERNGFKTKRNLMRKTLMNIMLKN